VSSTVECLPVVHGGMLRNSSKVKTRGLQHFQPEKLAVSRGRNVAKVRGKIRCHIVLGAMAHCEPLVDSWDTDLA
jgi:hypothetical protein